MDEYISKKDILQMIESTAMWNRSFSVLYEDIEDMKPANVSPVRHGRWIKESDGGTRCSVCNKRVRDVTGGWNEPVDLSDMPYCPKCGARMNEEVKHER